MLVDVEVPDAERWLREDEEVEEEDNYRAFAYRRWFWCRVFRTI